MDRSVSLGVPRVSGALSVGELAAPLLRSWTGHSGGATSRFTRCHRVLRAAANSATKCMLLRLLRELGHLLPLCGRLDARESAVLAEELVADTAAKQGISRGQLTLHADRGSSMTSKKRLRCCSPTSGSASPTCGLSYRRCRPPKSPTPSRQGRGPGCRRDPGQSVQRDGAITPKRCWRWRCVPVMLARIPSPTTSRS